MILGSLRLIILFMEANFLVLFALGILITSIHFSHVCFQTSKCISKTNSVFFPFLRNFQKGNLETSEKEARRQTGYGQHAFLRPSCRAAEKEQLVHPKASCQAAPISCHENDYSRNPGSAFSLLYLESSQILDISTFSS